MLKLYRIFAESSFLEFICIWTHLLKYLNEPKAKNNLWSNVLQQRILLRHPRREICTNIPLGIRQAARSVY